LFASMLLSFQSARGVAGGLDRAARDLVQLRVAGGMPRGGLGDVMVGDEVGAGTPGGVVLGR
jgi:hypothetical protein